jgi:hypothetical protein
MDTKFNLSKEDILYFIKRFVIEKIIMNGNNKNNFLRKVFTLIFDAIIKIKIIIK